MQIGKKIFSWQKEDIVVGISGILTLSTILLTGSINILTIFGWGFTGLIGFYVEIAKVTKGSVW